MARPTTLDELFELMKMNHPSVLDLHGQWRTDLPAFGGPEPRDTTAIWSWDTDRIIVGSCTDDLTLEARAEFAAELNSP